MGSSKRALVLFMVLVAIQVCMGVDYTVGDSAGWTAAGVDYENWASSKSFQIGDTFVFNYSPEEHNVLQVKEEDYSACNTASPIATYSTGKDAVTIKNNDNYFICGIPGHCQLGQKVKITVKSA